MKNLNSQAKEGLNKYSIEATLEHKDVNSKKYIKNKTSSNNELEVKNMIKEYEKNLADKATLT